MGMGRRVLRGTYLENLSGIDQPLAVSRRIRLLRNGVLELLHGLVCLYRYL